MMNMGWSGPGKSISDADPHARGVRLEATCGVTQQGIGEKHGKNNSRP